MNLKEFSEKWINENVSREPYDKMPIYLAELMNTLIKQNHSGSSWSLLLHYFAQLMHDYENQESE